MRARPPLRRCGPEGHWQDPCPRPFRCHVPGDPVGKGPDGQQRPACAIQQGEKDPVWIPKAAQAGWVIITRDRHLRHRPAELSAIVSNRAKVVRLDARHALNRWAELEIVVGQWRRIEGLADLPGPWLFTASRTNIRRERL